MSDDLRSDGRVRETSAADGRPVDPGWLVHGDPVRVLAALDAAAGRWAESAAAVYRASGHVHRDAAAGVRRQVLALDAARYGDRELARDIAEVPTGQGADEAWAVRWATGSGLDSRLRYALPAPAEVGAVGAVVVRDLAVVVAGCKDGTLHWWDLATGRGLGTAETGHTGEVRALVTAVLDGRPVAVTSGSEGTVRVWDLARGELAGSFRVGGDAWVHRLAVQRVQGRPLVVGGGTDGVMRLWDPAVFTGGPLLTVRTGAVSALATAAPDGRPVALTGHSQGAVRMWDLITGREVGAPSAEGRDGDDDGARDDDDGDGNGDEDGDGGMRVCVSLELAATTQVLATDPTSGSASAVSADAYEVRVLDLATGEQIGEPVPAAFVEAAAVTVLGGRPAALVGYSGRVPVQVWDLATRAHLCRPLTGHEGTVRGVATAVVRGRHLAVTGGDDGSVRVWDLDGGREPGGRARPVQRFATAVVDGRAVVVTAEGDDLRIRDLDDGELLGEPLTGQSGGVDLLTVGTVNGRPTLITRDRSAVRIWDLTTREQVHGRSTREYTSPSIQFFAVLQGRFVAVTGTGRVWDLTTSAWTGVEPRQSGGRALAVEALGGRDVVVTRSGSNAVQLWDLATGEPLGPPMTGLTGDVRAGAAGMRDGRVVVAAGGDDATVRVWDAGTGQQIGAYAFPAGVKGLSMAPDGRLVVGFGSDIAVLAHG
ncbi:WD40 repeat domain-containing protein [Streptomyces sp. NPDC000658]|uniref:WD40 repeat domain-containing protein n=1 Tax=Streptomyces sp. NPDC000658 TaxID=3154266 RepID=UPI00332339FB